MKIVKPLVVAALAGTFSLPGFAFTVLDFEGIWGPPESASNLAVRSMPVLDFYGGTTSYTAGLGVLGQSAVDYGITFGSNAIGIRSQNAPAPYGSGLFENNVFSNPSTPDIASSTSLGVLGFENRLGVDFTINVPQGFTSLSFQWSTLDDFGVEVYNGATKLQLTNRGGEPSFTESFEDFSGACSAPVGPGDHPFCRWQREGLSFTGTATSVRFFAINGDGTNYTLIDDLAFNDLKVQTHAVPEPSTYALMALGLLGIGFATRRRMRPG